MRQVYRASMMVIGLAVSSSALGQPQQPDGDQTKKQMQADERGTAQSPLIVKVLPTPKSAAEAEQDSKESADKSTNDRVNLIIAAFTAVVLLFQLIVFGYQGWQLRRTVRAMRKIADDQGKDTKEIIAESAKTATALGSVAASMAENTVSVKQSVETQSRMAQRQELIGELQTRAFVAVNYLGLVPQNNDTMYRFEPRMQIVGTGLTPAYKVQYQAGCDILPFPLPNGFEFQIPDIPPGGVGMLGPRNIFTISAVAPRMYSDLEIAEIKAGITRRLFIWGKITYEDAFKKERYVTFAQSIVWFADGITNTGMNADRYNDAN
jgi:hypothetical protein